MSTPILKKGESYIGKIEDPMLPSYHLILVDVSYKVLTWEAALAWASSLTEGGDLPNLLDFALLEKCKDNHKDKLVDWFWSNTSHPVQTNNAWFHSFFNGEDSHNGKIIKMCQGACVIRVPTKENV